jgi:formiminoglutamate deiminase
LTLDRGKISRVESDVSFDDNDERHGIALPGIPNLHSHAFQRAMAGFAERRGAGGDNFWTWREAMYRFADRMGPSELEAVAAQAYVEMLESGFTRVGEFHYVHHDRGGVAYADPAEMAGALSRAAATTGLGLTLLPVLYQDGGFGGAAPGTAQRRFICDLDLFARLLESCAKHIEPLGDGVLGLAPHSLRAVSPGALSAAVAMTKGPVHIHIAEQTKEVDDCLTWSGMRPVQWLLAHQNVDARWCLVHATHMVDAETLTLAASGAIVGLCPITEANLGDGVFPARTYQNAGGAFGVGSDSNVRIDAAEELRLLEYGQRLLLRERNVLAEPGQSVGATLLRAAVVGGGSALGSSAAVKEGASADIVSLFPHAPALAEKGGDEIADAFLFAGGRELIDCVWRAGEKVVESGRHRAREAVAQNYLAAMRRLLA